MRRNLKSVLVISPALAGLLFGWCLVIIYFGRTHNDYVKELKQRPYFDSRSNSDEASIYVINFMQYWIFALGVPATVGLAAFHRLTGYGILGAIASVTEVVCAATVGGMLPYFSDGLYMFETLDDDLKGYTVIGFLGAMVSLIAIMVLAGVIPYVENHLLAVNAGPYRVVGHPNDEIL